MWVWNWFQLQPSSRVGTTTTKYSRLILTILAQPEDVFDQYGFLGLVKCHLKFLHIVWEAFHWQQHFWVSVQNWWTTSRADFSCNEMANWCSRSHWLGQDRLPIPVGKHQQQIVLQIWDQIIIVVECLAQAASFQVHQGFQLLSH